MSHVYSALNVILAASVVAALIRVVRGPTPADRMLAAQLFGTTGVAILLIMGHGRLGQTPLLDVALVFALFAAVTAVAFARRAWPHMEITRGER